MKKFIIPLAAAAALAIVPSSALAASEWGGWGQSHSDNLASPAYLATFGNNGPGNSQYCVDPNTQNTHCGTTGTLPIVYSPVETAGVFLPPPGSGCSHETTTGKDGSGNAVQLPVGPGPTDPCSPTSGDTLGALYLGFAGGGGIIGAQG
jgi:hypothetical protein